jgi:hypothetical protein
MTAVFTPERLFAELPQATFDDYATFESALVAGYNRHRFDFPPGYGWRDALQWALRREVVAREGSRIIVRIAKT